MDTPDTASAFQREVELQRRLAEAEFIRQILSELDRSAESIFPYVFARREVQIAGCIPDLVIVRFAEPPSGELWPTRSTFRHAFVVSLLRRYGRLFPETLAAKAFSRLERIQPTVDDLLASGAIAESNSGAVFLSPRWATTCVEVVAVEAKLRRWREALEQAQSYSRFADRTLVAMDQAFAPRDLEEHKEFRRRGVGLISVGPESFECLAPPARSSLKPSPEWEYIVSSVVSAKGQGRWALR
jgi:hypothetical protein